MSIGSNMSSEELYEFEVGNLISKISEITYGQLQDFYTAMWMYETIEPTLDPMQKDAWTIVLDMMAQKEAVA